MSWWKSIFFILAALIIASIGAYLWHEFGAVFGLPALGLGFFGLLGTAHGKGSQGVGGDGDRSGKDGSLGDARNESRRADEAAKRGLERLDGIKAEIDGHDSRAASRLKRSTEILDESRRIFRKEFEGSNAEDDSD